MYYNCFIHSSVDGPVGCFYVLAIVNSAVCVFVLVSKSYLTATPWTVACQASLSIEFPRQSIQEWVDTSFFWGSSNPGIKPASPLVQFFNHLQMDSLPLSQLENPNIGMYVSFSIMVFSGYMPSSGIAGSSWLHMGSSLVVVCGLLIVVASRVAEYGLNSCGTQA